MSKSTNHSSDASDTPQAHCGKFANDRPFVRELSVVKEELVRLNAVVRIDELTGLFNFRHFQQSIDLEMERARRSGHPMSLLMLDIDHFKKFNGCWGHERGNVALRHVSRIIQDALRRLDIPCRYGGEEFAIILPSTSLHAAINIAERLRQGIEEPALVFDEKTALVTASLGVDVYLPNDNDDVSSFVARTDACLYEAKDAGRNCVRHAIDREATHVSKEERDFLLGDV